MAAMAASDPEKAVIEAIQRGDRSAFEALVRRHDRWVRGTVFALLGERDQVDDVVQQAWTAAWQRFGDLRDVQRWRVWLYQLVRNAALDAGREASRSKRRAERLAAEAREAIGTETPASALIADERRRTVLAAIEALPPMYREPFVLRHLEDWSYQQIAEVLGCPVDTVETRLVRARRLLRQALQGKV